MGIIEHKYLEDSLAICPSNKLTVSRFSGSDMAAIVLGF